MVKKSTTTTTTSSGRLTVVAVASLAVSGVMGLGPIATSQSGPTTLQLDGATINVPATSDGCSVTLEAYQPGQSLPESVSALSGFVALSGCEGKFLGKAVEVKLQAGQLSGTQCVGKYNAELNDVRCMSLCSEGSEMSCTDGAGIFVVIDQTVGSCGALPALTEAEPPAFIKGDMAMSANMLTVSIKSKRYESRQNMPEIRLGSFGQGCVPQVDWRLVQSDRVNCWDEYQAQYNWSVLSSDACGLVQTPAADTTTFAGDFRVAETDLHFIRGDVIRRTTDFPLRMSIVLPVWQEASTTTKVFAPINGISVITSSSFDRVSGNLTVSVLTSVQYPFDLVLNANSAGFNGDGIAGVDSLQPISNNCNNQASPLSCAVTSRFILSTSDCVINGELSYSLSLSCSSFEANCPLEGTETVNIVVSFPGTFVCGNVSVDVDPSTLQMQIATFQDGAHSIAKAGFLFGQTVFVHTAIQSSAVDLVSASLVSARAQLAGAAPLPSPVNLMQLPSFAMTPSEGALPTDVDFQFLVNRANFPVPTDQSRALTITAKVAVVYRNNKRALLDIVMRQVQEGGNVTKQAAVAVDLVSIGTTGQQPDNAAMESDATSLSIGASLLLTLTVLPMLLF